MAAGLYIGLMSGTSLDGIDGVLFDAEAMAVIGHVHAPFAPALRDELLALNTPGDNELHRAALAANAVARGYADVVSQLLEATGTPRAQVRALGAHGQTVRHQPGGPEAYTTQLLNGALLAEQAGIAVICDLRSRDVAAGGQGAPLVPAFHRAVFSAAGEDVAVLNLGGIANLSLLFADGHTGGFDCGPANCLMDGWIARHRGLAYDADGAWAASGRVQPALLAALLAEPWFALPPPKSTGRDLFHLRWLDSRLAPGLAAEDVQATLLELSARCVADALRAQMPGAATLIACGGGALNGTLMRRLAALLPGVATQTSAEHGLPVDQVEAAAFAWLAHRFVEGLQGNLPAVTGAAGPRLLGALYPA
ncbi:anhydro-N-acetylmuramic acid kinase [Roseateles saccharophilus]|uniref:Anhydro-N-acetylmuramic acid kinase n=1 Tax=Roseateles saccharophilus TaxID=304 RepID=A0A4R3VEG4_ROSSA|nr:anhydro-N-acetylmuramic acid kinase [Roseateles saccharophilus]TCV02019.1 anhydro-N-acetylmuramic acid kinase [Roseateles saccharophilus]